jgi:DNA invertase Pin-like site-specific DNA recombinase
MKAIRAVAYVRRSTKDQVQSLERQRHEIERYAKERAVECVRWYEDDGISGTEDELRPGFQRMIADAERRRDVSVILVHELSRFGRFDAYQLGSWLNRLRAAGVRVQGIAGSVRDPYSREGKLLLALEQDRQESVRLSLRTLSGQRETASKGLRAGGKVPYGFARRLRRPDGSVEVLGRFGRAKRDKGELVELVAGDPEEVEIVRSIFSWSIAGDGLATIAGRLNARGVASPDAPRGPTVATKRGAWTAATVRAILRNPAYVGDAVWNVRSMPKFHRLEGDTIREIDEFETSRFRMNPRADWVTVRNAHPPLVERSTFDVLCRRAAERSSVPRARAHEYLLAGLVVCANCGNVMNGSTRTKVKRNGRGVKRYAYPGYVCSGGVKSKGCRQVSIPRDGLEKAVLRILDSEVFSPGEIARLEYALRDEMKRRAKGSDSETFRNLEKRERDLASRVSEGARRLLSVESALVPDVRDALSGMKAELEGVRAALESARSQDAKDWSKPEDLIRATIEETRAVSKTIRDPSQSLERRREALRRFLPARNGERPIRIEFDFAAGTGWRRAMTRATVRHLSLRRARRASPGTGAVAPNVVAGAVAAEARHSDAPGRRPVDKLPTGERELVASNFEEVGELVGFGPAA